MKVSLFVKNVNQMFLRLDSGKTPMILHGCVSAGMYQR